MATATRLVATTVMVTVGVATRATITMVINMASMAVTTLIATDTTRKLNLLHHVVVA